MVSPAQSDVIFLASLPTLPPEIKFHILTFLTKTHPKKAACDVITASKICKSWYRLVCNAPTMLQLLKSITYHTTALDVARVLNTKHSFLKIIRDKTITSWKLYTQNNLIYGKELYTAVQRRDQDAIRRLLTYRNLAINWRNKTHETPLMWATCKKGCKEILLLLLATHIDPDLQDRNGNSALMWATDAQGGSANVLALLAAGADPDMQDQWGNTALIRAAAQGKKNIVEVLIHAQANLNIKNKRGETALMATTITKNGHKDIAELLLNAQADCKSTNNHGFTVYEKARQKEQYDIAELMKRSQPAKNGCSLS